MEWSKRLWEKKLSHSISFQLFITLLKLRLGFNIFNWTLVLLVDIQLGQYLLPGLCFFFITLRTTDISCFLNNKISKIFYQSYFVLLKTSTLQLSVQSLNVRCHETAANMEIFRYSPYKNHCTMKCFIAINPNGAARFIWFLRR